jgi:hypothetical protein
MIEDDGLTPEEQDGLQRLARERKAPEGLEDRVVGALRKRGHISARRWPALLPIAASLLIAAASFSAGRLSRGETASSAQDGRYLLLLYGGAATPSEEASRVAEYSAWARAERGAGRLLSGERLDPAATVLGPSIAGGAGPTGFFVIRAGNSVAAGEVAARCPHLLHGGTVVVRPIWATK